MTDGGEDDNGKGSVPATASRLFAMNWFPDHLKEKMSYEGPASATDRRVIPLQIGLPTRQQQRKSPRTEKTMRRGWSPTGSIWSSVIVILPTLPDLDTNNNNRDDITGYMDFTEWCG